MIAPKMSIPPLVIALQPSASEIKPAVIPPTMPPTSNSVLIIPESSTFKFARRKSLVIEGKNCHWLKLFLKKIDTYNCA